MSEVNVNSQSHSKPSSKKVVWYKSPWLIGWLLLVLTVLAVNAYMIMQSINDFPGLVVDDFYERGQDYEENIHKKLKNNEKWFPTFDVKDVYYNKETTILFSMTDKAGVPTKPDTITLFAYRPSNSKIDFSKPMTLSKEESNNGKIIYEAKMIFPAKGKWDLLASVNIEGIEVNYPKKIFAKDEIVK
ncbi:MAG: nitrogen fixation protein FixH [Gammaproteobacteria bacterium]|nr:nitrogen fixation protein FixH [Gammaproteobacteria bacterium]